MKTVLRLNMLELSPINYWRTVKPLNTNHISLFYTISYSLQGRPYLYLFAMIKIKVIILPVNVLLLDLFFEMSNSSAYHEIRTH